MQCLVAEDGMKLVHKYIQYVPKDMIISYLTEKLDGQNRRIGDELCLGKDRGGRGQKR